MTQKRFSGMRKRGEEEKGKVNGSEGKGKGKQVSSRKLPEKKTDLRLGFGRGKRTCAKEEKSCGKKRSDAFYGLNRRFSSPFPFFRNAVCTHPQSLFPPSVLFGGAAEDSNAPSSSSSSSFLSRLSERAGFTPHRTCPYQSVCFFVSKLNTTVFSKKVSKENSADRLKRDR